MAEATWQRMEERAFREARRREFERAFDFIDIDIFRLFRVKEVNLQIRCARD
jgi:hypothetical protein